MSVISTWICKRVSVKACLAALALVGLTGCAELQDRINTGLSVFSNPPDDKDQGIRTLALMQGEVRARGPEGYCIDQQASNARRGFVVMVGCGILAEETGIMPRLDGLITVQFGAPQTASVNGNEEAFAEFLTTQAGRVALSASGDMAELSQVTTIADRAGVLARFEDKSAPTLTGAPNPQWRGFLDVRGRLVTISVQSFERNILSATDGERLLVAAMAEVAEVNAPASP